jgi:hypothetical protein
MARTPSGTAIAVATAFAASLAFSAASNASEAVLTVSGATLVAGDFVEVTSGWGRLNNRIFRLKAATSSALTLEGCDTTNLANFPTGLGAGSVRKVSTWSPVSNYTNLTFAGGEPKTATVTFTDTEDDQTLFDGASALSYTVDMDADAVGTAPYLALKTLSDSGTASVLRMTTKGGAIILLSCTVFLNENPSMNGGQAMLNKVTFFGRGRVVRYAS